MANTIYASTSSVRVDLKFEKTVYSGYEGDSYTVTEEWSSDVCPQYVVSMTHSIRGSGKANDLSLTLYHHLDPYGSDSTYGIKYEADEFGLTANDPSYIMHLIAEGFGKLYIRYGYSHSSEVDTAFSSDSASKTTEWFQMYITDMSASFDPNGVTYTITAISTLVYDTNLMGGVTYDWWTDPSGRYDTENGGVLDSNQMISVNNTKTSTDIQQAGSMAVLQRIQGIIKYVAKKAGYTPEISTMFSGSDSLVNFENTSEFSQDANTPDMQFINFLLNKIITYDKRWFNPPLVVMREYGYNESVTEGYVWRRNWAIIVDDTNKKLKVDYTYIDYTRGDLTEIEGRDISQFSDYDQRWYSVFLTEMNNNGTSVGSLFYNYPSFNRDIFDVQTISKTDAFKNSPDIASSSAPNFTVESDIISLDLQYPIIAGLAGAYSESYNTAMVDGTGEMVTGGDCAFTASGQYNPSNIFKVFTGQDFKKIMGRLYVSGSVTVPGLARVVSILSLVNIFVYITNKLDVTSGQYTILDQVDTITNGVYTTQLGLMKSRTFDNSVVYELADKSAVSSPDSTTVDAFTGEKVYISSVAIQLVDIETNSSSQNVMTKGKTYTIYILGNEGGTASYGGFSPEITLYKESSPTTSWGKVIVNDTWKNSTVVNRIYCEAYITPDVSSSITSSEKMILKAKLKTGETTYTPEVTKEIYLVVA